MPTVTAPSEPLPNGSVNWRLRNQRAELTTDIVTSDEGETQAGGAFWSRGVAEAEGGGIGESAEYALPQLSTRIPMHTELSMRSERYPRGRERGPPRYGCLRNYPSPPVVEPDVAPPERLDDCACDRSCLEFPMHLADVGPDGRNGQTELCRHVLDRRAVRQFLEYVLLPAGEGGSAVARPLSAEPLA